MSSTDRLVFVPPRERAAPRALLLALLVHGLLVLALTWSVRWKRSEPPPALAAELWVAPAPVPESAARISPRSQEPAEQPDADIALKTAKKRPPVPAPQRPGDTTPAKPKPPQRPLEKATAQPPPKAPPPKSQPRPDPRVNEAALQKQREDNLRRILGQAGGATTGAAAGGRGQASSGYGALLTAAIKKNVVWTEDTEDNPTAEIEVRITADGSIIPPPRLRKPSGNPAWDAAALKAITRTGRLPPDVDGRWPSSSFLIEMRPKN